MISTEEVSEWVPHGRGVVSKHPIFESIDELRIGSVGASLLDDDLVTTPGQESWTLLEGGEEVYSSDKTAVISRGGLTIKCFTISNPIHQTLRCTFHSYPDRPPMLPSQVSTEPEGNALPSVCIRDHEVLKVFGDQGQDFNVALLFPVRNCWSSKFGLLLERHVTATQVSHVGDNDLDTGSAVLFFLLHLHSLNIRRMKLSSLELQTFPYF